MNAVRMLFADLSNYIRDRLRSFIYGKNDLPYSIGALNIRPTQPKKSHLFYVKNFFA